MNSVRQLAPSSSSFITAHALARHSKNTLTATHLKNEAGGATPSQLTHTSFFHPARLKLNPSRSRAFGEPGDASQRRCTEVTN